MTSKGAFDSTSWQRRDRSLHLWDTRERPYRQDVGLETGIETDLPAPYLETLLAYMDWMAAGAIRHSLLPESDQRHSGRIDILMDELDKAGLDSRFLGEPGSGNALAFEVLQLTARLRRGGSRLADPQSSPIIDLALDERRQQDVLLGMALNEAYWRMIIATRFSKEYRSGMRHRLAARRPRERDPLKELELAKLSRDFDELIDNGMSREAACRQLSKSYQDADGKQLTPSGIKSTIRRYRMRQKKLMQLG